MTPTAFIIGTLILGICIVAAAFVLSGAVTGAAAAAKESAPQALQQPTLSFLTEFDAADYLGVSLNELDYMRGEGMLDNTFVAVTSMEQTGEEEYYAMEDGVEVIKVRPIMAPVTRFLFNRQLLDERMLEIIKQGQHVNPTRGKSGSKGKGKSDGGQKSSKNGSNGSKNGGSRPERRDGEHKQDRREGEGSQGGKKPSDRPENRKNGGNGNGSGSNDRPAKKPSDRPEEGRKPQRPADDPSAKSKAPTEPHKSRPAFDDSDDDIFARPAKSAPADDFFGGSKASIVVDDDDDGFDLDVFGRGDSSKK